METVSLSKFKKVSKDKAMEWFTLKGEVHYANDELAIHFPSTYVDKELCILGGRTKLLCIFAIINYSKKEYAVASAPCMHTFNGLRIINVLVKDKPYVELKYSKGDVVMPILTTVISDDFIFTLFELFFINGKIPWFLEYENVAGLLQDCRKFADSGIGDNPIGPHILCSLVARCQGALDVYYRERINKPSDLDKLGTPSYIGLSNPFLSYENTTSKLIGSYLGDGMKAAVMNQSDKMQQLDQALIK